MMTIRKDDPFDKYRQKPESPEAYAERQTIVSSADDGIVIKKDTNQKSPLGSVKKLLLFIATGATLYCGLKNNTDTPKSEANIIKTEQSGTTHKPKKSTRHEPKAATRVTSTDGRKWLKNLKSKQPDLYKIAKERALPNTILPMSPLRETGIGRYNQVEIKQLEDKMSALDAAGNESLMIYECIKFFEGEKPATYKDHLGKKTIGIGFLLPDDPEPWRKKLVEDTFVGKSYREVCQIGFKTTPEQRAALTYGFLEVSGITQDFTKIIQEACGEKENDTYKVKNIPRDYLAYLFTMLYQCPNTFNAFKEYNLPFLKILATKPSEEITYKNKKQAMINICEGFANNKLLKTQQAKPIFEKDRSRLLGKAAVIQNCVKGDIDAPLPASFIANQMFAMHRDQSKDKNGPPLIVLIGKTPEGIYLKDLLLHPEARANKWENGTVVYFPALNLKATKDNNGFSKKYLGKDAEEKAQKNGTRLDFSQPTSDFETTLKTFKHNLFDKLIARQTKGPTHGG